MVDHIPGLGEYLQQSVPAIMWLESMRSNLVPFRCHGHNALELDHVYHAADGTAQHLGYEALCIC